MCNLNRMKPLDFVVVGIAGVIVAMGLVYIYGRECKRPSFEGFTTQDSVMACPAGSKSFINRTGDLLCCKGEVDGYDCTGQIVCSFSSSATARGYPSCASVQTTFGPPKRNVLAVPEAYKQNPKGAMERFLLWLQTMAANKALYAEPERKKYTSLYEQLSAWNQTYGAQSDASVANELAYTTQEVLKFCDTNTKKESVSGQLPNSFLTLSVEQLKYNLQEMKRKNP